MNKHLFFKLSQDSDQSGPSPQVQQQLDQYKTVVGDLPYNHAAYLGGYGVLAGASIGALVQALRKKSLLKGLGYGALLGGLGGAGLGAYSGYREKQHGLSPEVLDRFQRKLTNDEYKARQLYETEQMIEEGIRLGYIDPKRNWRDSHIDPPKDP